MTSIPSDGPGDGRGARVEDYERTAAGPTAGLPCGATVLVLDRDPQIGMALMNALADRGYEVVTWLSPQPIPDHLLELDPPRAAVIDPGSDGAGLSAVRWLRKRNCPVLIHSIEDAVDALRSATSGGDLYRIGKPATPTLVVDTFVAACWHHTVHLQCSHEARREDR